MEMPNPQIPMSADMPKVETPFQTMGQALALEKGVAEKKERQGEEQDRDALKQYLASGGNIFTPEGLQKAVEDLKGKVSPDLTMKLNQAHQNSEKNKTEQILNFSKLSEQEFQLKQQQTSFLDESLTQNYETYLKSAQTKGSQAALQDYNAAKQATLVEAQKLINPRTGQSFITPDMAQKYLAMSPAEAKSLHSTVQFENKMLKDAADLRFKQAEAAKNEASAFALKHGLASADIAPETIEYYAAKSMAGDDSWKVGLGRNKSGQAIIAAVEKKVPEMAKERGLTPAETSSFKATRDALSASLKDRTKFVAASNQFVANFGKEADIVEEYLKPGVGGKSPVLNRWIQAGRQKIAGDPEVSAFDTALRGLAREHQRIVTGVTSNAQLHASAQATADELLNVNMNEAQIRATLKVMREEAKNARDSGEDEVKSLTSQLEKVGAPKEKETAGKPAGGWSAKIVK